MKRLILFLLITLSSCKYEPDHKSFYFTDNLTLHTVVGKDTTHYPTNLKMVTYDYDTKVWVGITINDTIIVNLKDYVPQL